MVELKVLCVRQVREKAIQVILPGWGPFLWLPRSQIQDGLEIEAGMRDITIAVSEWIWAQKQGELDARRNQT